MTAALIGNIGAGLSGLGSLIGAFGGSKSPSRKREYDSHILAARAHASTIGETVGATKDAYVNAGYHPLVAVGNVPQPSAGGAVVGGSGPSAGDRIAAMGQGIGRAAAAFASKEERLKQDISDALDLEYKKKRNALLDAQTTAVHRAGRTPGIASTELTMDGQGESGVKIVPKEIVHNTGDRESGRAPSHQTFNYGAHSFTAPSQALKQAIEDSPADWLYSLTHTVPELAGAMARDSDLLNRVADWLVKMRGDSLLSSKRRGRIRNYPSRN